MFVFVHFTAHVQIWSRDDLVKAFSRIVAERVRTVRIKEIEAERGYKESEKLRAREAEARRDILVCKNLADSIKTLQVRWNFYLPLCTC